MSKACLEKCFNKLDKSGDGSLDGHELKALLAKCNPNITDREIAEYVTKIGGDDQKVNFEEFYLVYCKLDLNQIKPGDFEKCFKNLDKDGSGQLDASEVEALLANCEGFTAEKAKEEIEKHDKNGDGKISLDEFIKMFK